MPRSPAAVTPSRADSRRRAAKSAAAAAAGAAKPGRLSSDASFRLLLAAYLAVALLVFLGARARLADGAGEDVAQHPAHRRFMAASKLRNAASVAAKLAAAGGATAGGGLATAMFALPPAAAAAEPAPPAPPRDLVAVPAAADARAQPAAAASPAEVVPSASASASAFASAFASAATAADIALPVDVAASPAASAASPPPAAAEAPPVPAAPADVVANLPSPPPPLPAAAPDAAAAAAPAANSALSLAIVNEDASRPTAQRSIERMPPPSPAFAAAWARYRELHNSVTAALARGETPGNTIMIQPVGQLGNRVMAIAAGFVLGLLTDRAVYANFATGYYASATDLFADAGLVWEAAALPGGGAGPGCARSFNYAEPSGSAAELEFLLCEGAAAAAAGGGLCISSNQYFAPLLLRNPAYAARLAALFPHDGDVFGDIARELFRPSAEVAAMRDAFKAESRWAESFVVGLQLRTGPDFTDLGFAQDDWDITLAVADALLPPAAPRNATAFFVATDIEWSRDAAVPQLSRRGSRVLEYGVFMRSGTPRGCQQAFVDVLLLAEANDLVTTAWSTFGYLAAALTGIRAAVITHVAPAAPPLPSAHDELAASGAATYMGVVMHEDRRTGAARLPTAEPCYHFLAKNARVIADLPCYASASAAAGAPLLEGWLRGGRYC